MPFGFFFFFLIFLFFRIPVNGLCRNESVLVLPADEQPKGGARGCWGEQSWVPQATAVGRSQPRPHTASSQPPPQAPTNLFPSILKASFHIQKGSAQDFAHKRAPGPRKHRFVSPSAGGEAAASFAGALPRREAAPTLVFPRRGGRKPLKHDESI